MRPRRLAGVAARERREQVAAVAGEGGAVASAASRSIRLARSVSMADCIGRADHAIECLICASNHWVAEDHDAELRWSSIGSARGFRVQDRQLDGKMDGEIGKGFNARAHTPGMHFAGRYHNRVAGANSAFCSATPK